MISDSNEMIDRYILGELSGKELSDFEALLSDSENLKAEVKLYKEIINSVMEKDVIDLRSSLKAISNENFTQVPSQIIFDLAHNLTIADDINFDDHAIKVDNALQYIHIQNHMKNVGQRIHQVNLSANPDDEVFLGNQINDFTLWEDIKDAINEKNIIDLRSSIQGVMSKGFMDVSDFTIDEYLSNELSGEQALEIENMLSSGTLMANHIHFHKEIDQAINEEDVFNLRNSLHQIVDEEQQIRSSELKKIDDYLLHYLDEYERNDFDERLAENIRLKEELALNADINAAIIEKDVQNIRASISEFLDKNKSTTKERKLIPDSIKEKPFQALGAAASVAAIITTGFLTLNQGDMKAEKLFRQAYHPYEASGLFRSAAVASPAILGVDLYNAHRYDEAIEQFSLELKENPNLPMGNFFTGLCYMEKNQFQNAISAFQRVIDEKDNLFIEQAQWYIALSMLGSNKEKEACELLNQIVGSNGYYRKNAKEILKKME